MARRRSRDTWVFPTTITDHPDKILEMLGYDTHHHAAHFEASRGWQIVAVDRDGNLYLDCDEQNGVIHILR